MITIPIMNVKGLEIMRVVQRVFIIIRNLLIVLFFISTFTVAVSTHISVVYAKNREFVSMALDKFKQFAFEGNYEEAYEIWNSLEGKNDAIPIIRDLLKNPKPETRRIAIHCCSDFQPAVAIPLNAAALSDSLSDVRRTAMGYLISYHDKSVLPALLENLANYDGEIRAGVAEIIGKLGNETHLTHLNQQYDKEADLSVKKKIALAMAKLGDSKMKEKIVQQIHINDSNVRFQCLRDLQYIDDKNVAKELVDALDDSGNTYLLSNMGKIPERYLRVCDLAINIIAKWFDNPFTFSVDNYTNYSAEEIAEVKAFLGKL